MSFTLTEGIGQTEFRPHETIYICDLFHQLLDNMQKIGLQNECSYTDRLKIAECVYW